MTAHGDPLKALLSKQMYEKLGNCKTCRFAAVTLDKCERGKKGQPEFNYRFDSHCQYHERDHNWCN